MKKKKLLILLLILLFGGNYVFSQMVEKAEAEQIVKNWIQMVIDKYGHWGHGESAVLQPGQEFRNSNRMLGYYFQVLPTGYIVVSLRKELPPVKVYDDYYTLDPGADKGMTDLVKSSMLRIIDTIESRLGPIDAIDPSDFAALLEIDYRATWDWIYGYNQGTIQKNISGTDNYAEGEALLSSIWHQHPPYNNDCPYLGCTTTSNGRAYVGCVATAGAQIMKYWSWPPNGLGTGWDDAYDWANMPDNATTSSPAAVQAAVAELNHEVGVAVGMEYGCDASGAYTADMINVYEQYYAYHISCTYALRPSYSASDWFEQIKAQINANRPIHYRIPGHSIVCDGWQYFGFVMLYHMNYGWADGATTWYVVDDLQGGNFNEEYMVLNIVPNAAMGPNLSGTYAAQSYPYRYFDLDASGSSATFNSAQLLQILPELTITGTGTSTYVKFYGSTGLHTRIFTDGNLSEGILIQNGGIRLKNNGSIKLQ